MTTILDFPDSHAWESWLEAHPDASEAWLRIGRVRSPAGRIRIGHALDSALCFGWIDGRRERLDEASFLQRYCPRRPGSAWSQVNRAKAEALIEAGRVRPRGLAEIEAARADGRWDCAYEPQREAKVPPVLAAALAANPRARSAFEGLSRSDRYSLMLPVLKARTVAARERLAFRLAARLSGG